MKKRFLLIFVGLILTVFLVNRSSARDMEKRIEDLETQIMIAQDSSDDATEKLNNAMRVSGYSDVEYIMTDETGKTDGFRMHHLSLFFKKQISEKWRFFSEIEFEDGPLFEFDDATTTDDEKDKDGKPITLKSDAIAHKNSDAGGGKIYVEAVNFDFLYKPQLNIRVGRFFTPAGIWSIDHYPPFVTTQERPLHIRQIFPQLVDGAMIYGNYAIGSAFFNYDLYIGNGEKNTGNKDGNNNKAVGLRPYLYLPVLNHFEIGASYYSETQNDETKKSSMGFHSKIAASNVKFQLEYASASIEDPLVAKSFNIIGYYGQLAYNWRDYTVGGRYDYYDENDTESDNAITITSFFVNYHVSPNIVLKAEHHLNDNEKETTDDYSKTILSVGIYLE